MPGYGLFPETIHIPGGAKNRLLRNIQQLTVLAMAGAKLLCLRLKIMMTGESDDL